MSRGPPRSALFPYPTLFRSLQFVGGVWPGTISSNAALASAKVFHGDLTMLLPHRQVAVEDFCRSEEHTSELQSRLHLVCRLLLEKKKSMLSHDSYSHASLLA